MFHRSNARALESLSSPPIDQMSQCEWFKPFWEPPHSVGTNEYTRVWTERAENGEPEQESTHAPAHFYNNCGEEFDDCFGEL